MYTSAIFFVSMVFLLHVPRHETICWNEFGDKSQGGSCYVTSHTVTHTLMSSDTAWKEEGLIKEFHFHTYWFQHRNDSYKSALRIQRELITAVKQKKFVAVLPGITKEILPGIIDSEVPFINTEPIGPHPCGSFETWVPREYFSDVMSFFMQRRGELTIFIHPITRWNIEDHVGMATWLGPPMKLDPTVLVADMEHPPAQYKELKLGYSAPH